MLYRGAVECADHGHDRRGVGAGGVGLVEQRGPCRASPGTTPAVAAQASTVRVTGVTGFPLNASRVWAVNR